MKVLMLFTILLFSSCIGGYSVYIPLLETMESSPAIQIKNLEPKKSSYNNILFIRDFDLSLFTTGNRSEKFIADCYATNLSAIGYNCHRITVNDSIYNQPNGIFLLSGKIPHFMLSMVFDDRQYIEGQVDLKLMQIVGGRAFIFWSQRFNVVIHEKPFIKNDIAIQYAINRLLLQSVSVIDSVILNQEMKK